MIETNVPHSEGDDAQTVSSDENQPHQDADSQYLPPFSRKRLTRRQWQLSFTLMGASVLICVVVVAAQIITVPYVSFSPGSVYSLSEAVSLDDGEGEFAIYPPESDMGFVTVRKSRKLSLWRLFFDSLDSRIDIEREIDVNRGLSQAELDRIRAASMLASQGDAVEVALRHLGLTSVVLLPNPTADSSHYPMSCFFGQRDDPQAAESRDKFFRTLIPLGDYGGQVNIVEGLRLLADSESRQMREDLEAFWKPQTKLLLGDIIRSANGQPIRNISDLEAVLEDTQPGETLNLGIQFFDQPAREVSMKLGESRREGLQVLDLEDVAYEPSETCPASQSWIALNWPDLELITKVSFDTGDVGGPSAGLAFALAVVDLLTEGDLTGGNRVATTGIFQTPFSDEVSSVGGVRQKSTAVRNSGYDVFLVPHNDYDEAVSAAGDELRVERVSTLRDALAILECLGGDPIASGGTASELDTTDLPACS